VQGIESAQFWSEGGEIEWVTAGGPGFNPCKNATNIFPDSWSIVSLPY
jgi:hypothetical protein